MDLLESTPPADAPDPRLSARDLLRLEEASLNAWPALRQLLVDGWLLRFAGGYTKRANSVNALYTPTGSQASDTEGRIAFCERQYAASGLPTIFRITPLTRPSDLDARLAARGYREFDATHVLALDLTGDYSTGTSDTAMFEVSLDGWLDTYTAFSGNADSPLRRAILDAILPAHYLGCLEHMGRIVACGMAVAEPPYVGLFSLITSPALRRRGYGRALVASLLAWGQQQGAITAYLQVQDSNIPAQALYANMGFREAYTYWYRVKG